MSKTVIHSYPWYISDWRESETRLAFSLEQRGLFRELIDYTYREGSLPTDRETLIKIAGCGIKEFDRAWPKVKGEFYEDEQGRFRNPKVDAVLPEIERWHEQRRKAGQKSGESRRSKPKAPVPTGNEQPFNGRSTDVQRELEPSTSTTTSTTTSTSLPPTPTPEDDKFGEFREVCELYGIQASEPDWQEAHVWEWKPLDFFQRLAAVQGIRDRIDAGATSDPAANALPKNYLHRRMWERKIRVDRPRGRDAVEEILGASN